MINVQLPAALSADYASGTSPLVSGGGATPMPASGSPPGNSGLPVADPVVQPKQPTEAELQQAVANLQQKAQKAAPNLQFSIDRDTSRIVIRVTDSSTQEVIHQFPPEEVLRMDRELERMQGMFLNKKA